MSCDTPSPAVPSWFCCNGPEQDIVISTRVRLARCLANQPFPLSASLMQRKRAYENVVSVVKALPRYASHAIVNFMDCGKLQQQMYVENRVASPDLIQSEGDRGVVCGAHGGMSLMINEEDHVRLQCIESGLCPDKTWSEATEADDELGMQLPFAFDSRRGFLTCCPTNSGTGLRISFLMHLPGLLLTRTAEQVLQGASQMGLSIRGFFGEHSSVVGSFFQLSNQATMGASESEFITATRDAIVKVIECERRARDKIVHDAKDELLDKVYRAYGILMYAQSLSMDELLNLTSAVRLGAECGIFDNVSVQQVNEMIIRCMPAHLQVQSGRKLDEKDCARYRADFVKKMLTAA